MKIRLSLALSIIISILAAGCQGQPLLANDPAEAVAAVAARQHEINSYHLDLNSKLTSETANIAGGVTANGDVNSEKNEFSLQGGVDLGLLTPLLAQGQGQISFGVVRVDGKQYTNVNHQGWQVTDAPPSRVDTGTSTSTNPTITTARDLLFATLLRNLTTVEQLPDESLLGVDVSHYRLTLVPASLIDMAANLLQRVTNGQFDATALDQARTAVQNSKAALDIWVNKETQFIQAFQFNIHYGGVATPQQSVALAPFDFTLNGRLSKINEPVTVTAPQ